MRKGVAASVGRSPFHVLWRLLVNITARTEVTLIVWLVSALLQSCAAQHPVRRRQETPMTSDAERSVTQWISDLKAGDDGEAARRLWDRYFTQLARLAHARLRARNRGAADGEDVALSAFESFFRGAAAGRFPRLEDRDDLWKLLTTIAAQKGP